MMNHAAKVLSCAAVCAGILTCATSCRDDDLLPGTDTDGRIAFMLAGSGGPVSRAVTDTGNDSSTVAASVSIPLHVAGDTIGLTFAAESNRGVTAAKKTLTRGIPFDNDSHTVSQFQVTAFRESGDKYFENLNVTLDGTNGVGLTSYYWPAGNLSFCAYACSKDISDFAPSFQKTEDGCSGSFDYSLPTADNKNDAANQPDLIFAMSHDQARITTPVSLLFHHALSAIVFKVGRMPEGVTLKSIILENVYSSGSCSMASEESDGIDNVKFTWMLSGEQTGEYTQKLNDQQAVQGERFGTEEHTFMMLPQEMAEETRFSLTFTIGEQEYTLFHAFKGIVDAWLPDTKYIFTIGLPDEVDVEVEDLVEGVVKKNVTIQNTGISTGYIRAAIVGYWVDSSTGDIVAPWNETEDGAFEYDTDWSIYWRNGSDGFYYHVQPVEHDGYTYPLFDKYTLSESAATNHSGQKLELNIVAQIVIESEVDKAWTIPAQ